MSQNASPASMRRGSRGRRSWGRNSDVAHDRAGDEMREERQVDSEVEEPRRPNHFPAHVDHVAERLEREERDPDRQQHVRDRRSPLDADPPEPVAGGVGEEAGVLEPSEHREVAHDRGDERGATGAVVLGPMDHVGHHLVADDRAGQEQRVVTVPGGVEEEAGRDHEDPPAHRLRHEQPAGRQDQSEEDREADGREQHVGSRDGRTGPCSGRNRRAPRPSHRAWKALRVRT